MAKWWISREQAGQPGDPVTSGPYSSWDDAVNARTFAERYSDPFTFSIFREDDR